MLPSLPAGYRSFAPACVVCIFFFLALVPFPSASAGEPSGATNAAQFLNISTRGYVEPGDRLLIGGFIVHGSVSKRVLLRGLGPTLPGLPSSELLTDPALEVRDAQGSLLFANDNWKSAQQTAIAATGLAPADDHEAAALVDLPGPAGYTVLLRGTNNSSGIALVEVYDLNPNEGSLLANVSTRAYGETGDRVTIGGFILGDGAPARVIARGIGPSLGLDDALPDPALELHSAQGEIGANNNWKSAQQTEIVQTGLAPANDLEAALVTELPSGGYTAILHDANGGTGTALVELFNLSSPPNPPATFSIETGLEGWVPHATDVDQPPVFWTVEQSQHRATEGTSSMRIAVNNLTDAAKVWGERVFSVRPSTSYHVTIDFSFATSDYGDLNHWTIIAGARSSSAVTRDDLVYQDSTANGAPTNVGYVWLEKSYQLDAVSSADGKLYVQLGVWGTWETFRAYYVDNIRITIAPN